MCRMSLKKPKMADRTLVFSLSWLLLHVLSQSVPSPSVADYLPFLRSWCGPNSVQRNWGVMRFLRGHISGPTQLLPKGLSKDNFDSLQFQFLCWLWISLMGNSPLQYQCRSLSFSRLPASSSLWQVLLLSCSLLLLKPQPTWTPSKLSLILLGLHLITFLC